MNVLRPWIAWLNLACACIAVASLVSCFYGHRAAEQAVRDYGHNVDSGAYVILAGVVFFAPAAVLFGFAANGAPAELARTLGDSGLGDRVAWCGAPLLGFLADRAMECVHGGLQVQENRSFLFLRQFDAIIFIGRLEKRRRDVSKYERFITLKCDRMLLEKPFVCRFKVLEGLLVAGKRGLNIALGNPSHLFCLLLEHSVNHEEHVDSELLSVRRQFAGSSHHERQQGRLLSTKLFHRSPRLAQIHLRDFLPC
jgi:hypothetical protein